MFKLGLTGVIGSGKSGVCKVFAEQGIEIIEADDVSPQVVVPGSGCLKEIQRKYGYGILLLEDGSLNRTKLRERIFSVGRLLHPAIRDLITTKLANASSPYFLKQNRSHW